MLAIDECQAARFALLCTTTVKRAQRARRPMPLWASYRTGSRTLLASLFAHGRTSELSVPRDIAPAAVSAGAST